MAPRRTMTALTVTVALTLVVAACTDASGDPAATPSPSPSPRVTPTAPVSPLASVTPASPVPSPTVDALAEELEALRETDRFVELAHHERAQRAPWARFAWEQFAPMRDGEVLFEWANREELWDSVMPDLRDQCLLAGPEADRPMWETDVVIPASVSPRWTNETTGGRGQFLEVSCSYHDVSLDRPADLWWGILVATDPDLRGAVAEVSDPIRVDEDAFPSLEAAVDAVSDQLWTWIRDQEPSE